MNNNIPKLIGFFFTALATSIIFEAISWSKYIKTYQLYSFVSSPSWFIKHILIALGITFLLFLIAKRPHKTSIKTLIIVSFGVLLGLVAQWGYQGTWFCDYPCEDVSGLLIPIYFGSSAFLGALIIGSLWYLLRKAPTWVMLVVTILSLPVIAFSVWRPIYQKEIVKDFPFYTEGRSAHVISPSSRHSDAYRILKSYIDTNKPITQKVSIKEWEAACKRFEKSSLGLQIYGATAATNCYAQGALLYDNATLCENLAYSGGAFRVTDSDCRGNLIPILHAEEQAASITQTTGNTPPVTSLDEWSRYEKNATKPILSGITFSGGIGLEEFDAIKITGANNEQEIKQAEQAYVKANFVDGSLLRADRIPVTDGSGNRFIMDAVFVQTPRDTLRIWFDLTSVVREE